MLCLEFKYLLPVRLRQQSAHAEQSRRHAVHRRSILTHSWVRHFLASPSSRPLHARVRWEPVAAIKRRGPFVLGSSQSTGFRSVALSIPHIATAGRITRSHAYAKRTLDTNRSPARWAPRGGRSRPHPSFLFKRYEQHRCSGLSFFIDEIHHDQHPSSSWPIMLADEARIGAGIVPRVQLHASRNAATLTARRC